MKYPAFVALLFFSSLILAQESPQVRMYSSVLRTGDFLNMDSRSIVFKEVISDSRCPTDVTCVWAGEAKILLAIYENGKFRENVIVSTTAGSLPLNFSEDHNKFSISGINLLPYPNTRSKNDKPEYTLQLKLTEEL